MNYCKACGKTVHETAVNCPHCGAIQNAIRPATLTTHGQTPIWTSITGMVLGLIPVISVFTPQAWTKDESLGAAMFATGALVFAGISMAKHHRGRGMAIAGLVLGVIGLLLALGSQS